jgi:hypothetical protein
MLLKKIITLLFLFIIQFAKNIQPDAFYQIPEIQNPQQVIPYSDEYFIIVKNEKVYKYNFENSLLEEISTRTQNELVGIADNGELIYCRFTHSLIQSYDEYSTTFEILDSNRTVINTYKFFETIRPLEINSQTISAKTAVDFLEEHYYEINIKNGDYEEIEKPEENKIYINLDLDWKKIYLYNQRMIIQDQEGNLFAF